MVEGLTDGQASDAATTIATLAASEARLRALAEAVTCGVLVRGPAGEIIDANRAAEEIIGVPLAELRGKRWTHALQRTHREDGTPLPEAERPMALALKTRRSVRNVTLSLLRPDGEERWLQVDAVPVLDAAGTVTRIVTSFVDVTEHKRAEAALRAGEERFRRLADNAPDVIYRFDVWPRRGLGYVSPAALRVTGYAPAELCAAPALLARLVHPEDWSLVQRLFAGEGTDDGPHVIRWLHRRGQVVWTEQQMAPVFEGGTLVAVEGIARDITDRLEAERQRERLQHAEKLRALGPMASGVAHDLNQYLALIVGHGDLALRALERPPPDLAGLREALRIICQAGTDGAETVKRLLRFARPRHAEPSEQIDLGDLLAEVAKLTAPHWRDTTQAEGRPVTLRLEVDDRQLVKGSQEGLREAFANLVFNAVDALPRGGTIALRAWRQGDQVIAEVADSGVGMSAEVQRRLFEPFFSTKGERGTGLGLAIVYGIVQRHGGQINVQSRPGAGTCFRIALPAAGGAPAAPPPAGSAPGSTGLRILAVNDEVTLTEMLAAMLRSDGHRVTTALAGEAALACLAAEPFDLVISDLGMGAGMNGWELAAVVRARYPGVRFMLATGWGAAIDPDEARAHGIEAVITKPYRLATLKQTLQLA